MSWSLGVTEVPAEDAVDKLSEQADNNYPNPDRDDGVTAQMGTAFEMIERIAEDYDFFNYANASGHIGVYDGDASSLSVAVSGKRKEV